MNLRKRVTLRNAHVRINIDDNKNKMNIHIQGFDEERNKLDWLHISLRNITKERPYGISENEEYYINENDFEGLMEDI